MLYRGYLGEAKSFKGTRWLWLALGLLGLMGVISILQHFKNIEAAAWVTRTHEVELQIKSLLANTIDAESGMRGYLLTSDEQFLEPYLGASQRIASDLQALHKLTADNPTQLQSLVRLEPLIKQRLDRLEVNIGLLRRDGLPAAQASVASGEGKVLQDQIRAILADMKTNEDALLRTRKAAAQASTQISIVITILTLLGAAASLVFAWWQLRQELQARSVVEDQVRGLNTQLAARGDELALRLQLAVRASNIGMWDWNVRNNEMYFSPILKSQLGYADDELANRFEEWESRLHPDDLPAAMQHLQTFLAAPKGDFESQFRLRHRDGSYRWILTRGEMIFGDSDKPLSMIGTHIDFTAHKEVENTIRESERSLQLIMNGVGPGIFMGLMTPDGVLIDANRPALEAGGLTREEVLNKPLDETPWIAHSAVVQGQVREAIARAQHGEPSRFDMQARFADDRIVWLDFSLQPITNIAGEVTYLVPSAVSIEAHKQAENALRESQELLQLFIAHAPVALAMFDRDMRYIAVSHQWQKDYGLGERDIIGQSHYEISPEVPQPWKDIHRRGLAGETVRTDEDRFARADGSLQWLRWAVLPWRVGDGAIGGIIIFSEDISERREAQEKVREQLDELLRWQSVTITREERLIEMKTEVNQLLAAQGLPPRYGQML